MRGLRCNLRFFGLKLYFFWGFKGLKPLINLAIFFKFKIQPSATADGWSEWYTTTNAVETLSFVTNKCQHVGWRLRLLRMTFLHQRIGHINIRDNHGSTRGLTATVAADVILSNQFGLSPRNSECHSTSNPAVSAPADTAHIIGC